MTIRNILVRGTFADSNRNDPSSLNVDITDGTASFMREELALFVPARFSKPVATGIGVVGILLLFGFALFVAKRGTDPRAFAVNEVEVSGTLDYTDRDVLRERVIGHTETGFYTLDLDAVRADIKRLPWVAEAYLRRIPPDRLSIEVIEHEPAAKWNDDALISKRFELFKPPQLMPDSIQRAEWLVHFSTFPQLRGADGRHESVLAAYRRYQAELSGFDTQLETLIEDERFSQTLILGNQVSVRLGSTDHDTRMARFVDVYPAMVSELKGRAVKFDMRYRNGFAVTEPGSPRALSGIEAAARSTRGVDGAQTTAPVENANPNLNTDN